MEQEEDVSTKSVRKIREREIVEDGRISEQDGPHVTPRDYITF